MSWFVGDNTQEPFLDLCAFCAGLGECLSLNPLALALVWEALPPQPSVSRIR